MLEYLPSDAYRVLEVGCGAGAFGRLLLEKYPDVCLFGIEHNSQVAVEATENYEHVWVGDVCMVLEENEDQKFDLIVFNDVLEHLVDPWVCLMLSKRHLLPGGRIVSSIPNMRFWPILSDLIFQGDWRYRDAGVMDRTHLRFFTKKSIQGLFEDSGFIIVEISGINKTWKTSVRWRLLNILLLGQLNDCLYPQFAVVAKPAR